MNTVKRRTSRTVVAADSSSSSAASSVIMATMAPKSPPSLQSNKRKKPQQSLQQACFKFVGEYCATRPWETLVTFLVLFVVLFCLICPDPMITTTPVTPTSVGWPEYLFFDAGGKILAVLHIMYRIRQAYLIKSSEILCIMLCYIISFTILFEYVNLQDINQGQRVWPIVFLLIDIPRVTSLAHFVLCAKLSQHPRIFAKSMSILCPSFLIDTLSSIGVFGLFLLTNKDQWVRVGQYAILFNILNFGVYVMVYPAILKLYFELTHSRDSSGPNNHQMVDKLRRNVETDSQDIPRVKIVGMAILAIFHASRICLFTGESSSIYQIGFLVPFVTFIVWLSYNSLQQCNTSESMQSLVVFLSKQQEDIDVDTDDNDEEETSSSRSDEMLSSTDEGIGTSSDKKPVNRTSSGSATVKASKNCEDSSSDLSDYPCNSYKVRCLGSDFSKISSSTASTSVKQNNSSPALLKSEVEDVRPLEECREILKTDPSCLTDDEVILLMEAKDIRVHALEKVLNNHLRGVEVRRKYLLKQKHMKHMKSLQDLPYLDYNYELVMGACAESVIGVMTLPVGCVGPLMLDGRIYHVPMATTEGCLVASTNRGCSALTAAGGVRSQLYSDGMSRAPILEFTSIADVCEAMRWMKDQTNFRKMKQHFESTSRFAKLVDLQPVPVGSKLHVRFVATTGDAMGMNMLSKATEHTLTKLLDTTDFPDFKVISLSGNLCTDKKPSAMNWIRGRGKSVICEAIIPASILEKTLKTSTDKLVKNNISKNYEGSALAGSIGGNNAHAANIVTAIYIATGQDVAQTIESSNCMTQMLATGPDNKDLYMSVTMPSIEVGTVGGGTVLSAQGTCLDMLGVRGSNNTSPGANAKQLARIIAATVLAGELSLMSALTEGHLVRSHLRHNRSSATVASMSSITDSVSSNCVRPLEQKRT